MHLPLVPLAAFRSLIGPELSLQLDALLARREGDVVLFSDPRGTQLALLTVGPGKRCESLAAAASLEIDGLVALCALRADGEAGVERPSTSGSPGGVDPHVEESLRARENYLEEAEQRLAESAQRLAEREAQVEQREQMLLEKERDFFRRGGESAP